MDDYSLIDRLLHRVVLSKNFLGEALFDLEKALFLKSAAQDIGPHVFVTGLARAGTTTLLHALYASGQFATLTYADMPFVVAPNLWRQISRGSKKEIEKKERAHGDGISVDAQSAEAFEEVFWRTFYGKTYILDDKLIRHELEGDEIDDFAAYITLICRRGGRTRYLSKNNNNILRLKFLSNKMNSSQFFVPFRHPSEQAFSLLNQHNRFLKCPEFVADYMTWLCHFEFGATHKRFCLGDMRNTYNDPSSINYWIESWCNVYGHLIGVARERLENVMMVDYNLLCSSPGYWRALCAIAEVPISDEIPFRASKKEVPHAIDAELLRQALRIYEECQDVGRLALHAR